MPSDAVAMPTIIQSAPYSPPMLPIPQIPDAPVRSPNHSAFPVFKCSARVMINQVQVIGIREMCSDIYVHGMSVSDACGCAVV